MKTSIAVLSGGLAAMVVAQDASGLTDCGRMCLDNMQELYQPLGCGEASEGDDRDRCLCSTPDFAFGIHDCSVAACGQGESDELISFAQQFCSNLGVNWQTGVATVTNSGTTGVTTISAISVETATTSAAETTDGTETETVTSGVATSSVTARVVTSTSDGEPITTTLTGTDALATSNTGDGSTTTVTEGSSTSGDGSTTTVTEGSSTGSDEASTATNSADASASESAGQGGNEDDSAAMTFGAPVVGVLAAAGLAVLLL